MDNIFDARIPGLFLGQLGQLAFDILHFIFGCFSLDSHFFLCDGSFFFHLLLHSCSIVFGVFHQVLIFLTDFSSKLFLGVVVVVWALGLLLAVLLSLPGLGLLDGDDPILFVAALKNINHGAVFPVGRSSGRSLALLDLGRSLPGLS